MKKLIALDISGSHEITKNLKASIITLIKESGPCDLMIFHHEVDSLILNAHSELSKVEVALLSLDPGGMNFRPVFELANNPEYTSLTIITDGEIDPLGHQFSFHNREPNFFKPEDIKPSLEIKWIITSPKNSHHESFPGTRDYSLQSHPK